MDSRTTIEDLSVSRTRSSCRYTASKSLLFFLFDSGGFYIISFTPPESNYKKEEPGLEARECKGGGHQFLTSFSFKRKKIRNWIHCPPSLPGVSNAERSSL
jgi:hypothetical protein